MPDKKINVALLINLQLLPFQTLSPDTAAALKSWVDLLDEAVYENLDFYAHLYVAGPLLNALQREEYQPQMHRLRILASSGQLGIVASLLDNNLMEISGRPDDFYYQLNNYAALASIAFGVRPPRWEGIYYKPGLLCELPLKALARAAAEINAQPLLIAAGKGRSDDRPLSIFWQEVAGTGYYTVPVHLSFDSNCPVPTDLIERLQEAVDILEGPHNIFPLLVVEINVDFSAEPQSLVEGSLGLSKIIKGMLDDPTVELITFRSYADKAKAAGEVPYLGQNSMPATMRFSLRDLENQQHRLETSLLWNIRQRFPQAKDWLDLLGFGVADSSRRFEVMEDLLARFYPQTRLIVYRLLHRLRNLVYPPRVAAWTELEKQQACLLLALRLTGSLLALFKQRAPELGLVENRDWDGDEREELVLTNQRQFLVVQPGSGKMVFHQFIHPEVPTGAVEMACWLETRLDYSLGIDLRRYVSPPTADYERGWGSTRLFIKEEGEYRSLTPDTIPMLKVESSTPDERGVEVKIIRRECYTIPDELEVEIEQSYRLFDNTLEFKVQAVLSANVDQMYLGIDSPFITEGRTGIDEISYSLPEPTEHCFQSTSLYQFDQEGRVRNLFSINYNN